MLKQRCERRRIATRSQQQKLLDAPGIEAVLCSARGFASGAEET